jgi:hypothetical protein
MLGCVALAYVRTLYLVCRVTYAGERSLIQTQFCGLL